jgi:hypothetical protein
VKSDAQKERVISMFRATVVTILVAAAVGGASAAPAFAVKGCEEPTSNGKCLWIVNGTKLAEGAKKEITVKAKGAQVFKGKVSGTETELTSAELQAKEASIEGAIPGRAHATLIYKNVNVVKPKNCIVDKGTIQTSSFIWYWTWLYFNGVFIGYDEWWLPVTGPIWFALKFEGEKCSLNKVEADVEGEIITLVPEATSERAAHVLEAKKPESGEEIFSFGSEKPFRPKLTLGGEEATLTGDAEVQLVSGEKFGVD